MLLELSQHRLPEDVETPLVVAAEELGVEDLNVRVQVIHQRRDGVHRGKGVRRPGQVENMLLQPFLKL